MNADQHRLLTMLMYLASAIGIFAPITVIALAEIRESTSGTVRARS